MRSDLSGKRLIAEADMARLGRFPLEVVADMLGVSRQAVAYRVRVRGLSEWKVPGDRRVFVLYDDVVKDSAENT